VNIKSPDVKTGIENALSQAGINEVSVAQDRDKGVITLSGDVFTQEDKQKVDYVTKSVSGAAVVSNQIGVRPEGFESEAKSIDTNIDAAIAREFETALTAKNFDADVKYTVNNGVLTLNGDVNSQNKRNDVEKLAASIANVQQVVNQLQVKEQRATSTTT
jgi:hyperosmotically inducible periplasmic protein